jgi:iron complex outermembrane receptor protein
VGDLPKLHTTIQPLLAQEANIVKITGVKVNPTATGAEILLESASGTIPQPMIKREGNTITADILNAVLNLPERKDFQVVNPSNGITNVSVKQLDANNVQVSITGTDAVPAVNFVPSVNGLMLSLTTSNAKESDEDEIELVVIDERLRTYRVPTAAAATKTGIPLRDIPGSVQVIPHQLLEDQKITRLRDVVLNVSGVTPGGYGSQTTVGDSFIFRGFDSSTSGSTFFNGFRRYTDTGYGRDLDIANIEQIEILKGPASVLYGQGEPGGIINITTKQPLSTPYYNIEGTFGSFNFYRPTLDISDSLNTDKTVRYRLNLAYQKSDSYVDFVNTESWFAAPVFSFDLSKDTNLTIEGEYLNLAKGSYNGIPTLGTVVSNPLGQLPRSSFFDDPFARTIYELGAVGYRLQHRFNDDWSIRNGFKAVNYRIDEGYAFGLGVREDNRTLERDATYAETKGQSYIFQTDLLGKVQTGDIQHNLLFGLDLSWNRYDLRTFKASAGIPPIDIFNPVFSPIVYDTFQGASSATQNVIGIYAQDLITFSEQFKVLVGGRFDITKGSYADSQFGVSYNQENSAFSPRIGLVYQPIKPVSLYASWSRSFLPSPVSARNADNTPFEPTKGEAFEVGVKTEWLDGKLAATLAAYQITKQNVVTADPNIPDFSIQVGEQRSRGIEFDLVGQVAPGLNLIASYALTDAEITKDNSGNQGNRPSNVPRHSASLWATYEIQEGDLKGLGFGAGIFYVGDRQGDLENTFTLPSYFRTDAAIFYRQDKWRLALNFKNITNAYYFEGAEFGSVFPGAPFTVQGTLAVQF